MPADEPLAALLDGALPPDAQAAIEEALAADGDRLRELLSQERLDAVLRVILGGENDHARVKRAILAELAGGDAGAAKARLLGALAHSSPASPPSHKNPRALWTAWAVLAAAACIVAAFIFWPRPAPPAPHIAHTDVDATGHFPELDTAALAELDATPADTMPATRIAGQWPFAADSPWNTPLGDGARLEPVRGVSLAGLEVEFTPRRVVLSRGVDPLVRVRLPDGRAEAVHLDERIIGGGTRGAIPLVAVNLRENIAFEILTLRRISRDEATAEAFSRTNLLGTGFDAQRASALGGIIRSEEFERGIFHAVALRVPAPLLAGSTWPAPGAPAPGPGNLRIGTLLVLPPEITPESIAPAGTPAHRLARALRDYGAYITGIERPGHASFALHGHATHPPLPPDFLARLQIVANNTAETLAGGGARRQPAAPPWR